MALYFIPIQLEVFTKLIVDDRSILICTMTTTAAIFIMVASRNVDYMLTDVDTYNSTCLRNNHLLLDWPNADQIFQILSKATKFDQPNCFWPKLCNFSYILR